MVAMVSFVSVTLPVGEVGIVLLVPDEPNISIVTLSAFTAII